MKTQKINKINLLKKNQLAAWSVGSLEFSTLSDSSNLSLFQNSSGYSNIPLICHINFRIIFAIYLQKFCWDFGILIGITLNWFINLRRNGIFTMVSLPIHEHGISLHLFKFFISLVFCSFQHTRSCTCFVRFTPKCFVLSAGVTF